MVAVRQDSSNIPACFSQTLVLGPLSSQQVVAAQIVALIAEAGADNRIGASQQFVHQPVVDDTLLLFPSHHSPVQEKSGSLGAFHKLISYPQNIKEFSSVGKNLLIAFLCSNLHINIIHLGFFVALINVQNFLWKQNV